MARGPVSNELFLLNKGHFPAVVELAQKPVYPDAFGKTIGGDLTPLLTFIANTVVTTKQGVMDVLEERLVTREPAPPTTRPCT